MALYKRLFDPKVSGKCTKKCFWKEVIRARPEKMPKLGIPMSKKFEKVYFTFQLFSAPCIPVLQFLRCVPMGGPQTSLVNGDVY